jgi:hypothetical protein
MLRDRAVYKGYAAILVGVIASIIVVVLAKIVIDLFLGRRFPISELANWIGSGISIFIAWFVISGAVFVAMIAPMIIIGLRRGLIICIFLLFLSQIYFVFNYKESLYSGLLEGDYSIYLDAISLIILFATILLVGIFGRASRNALIP